MLIQGGNVILMKQTSASRPLRIIFEENSIIMIDEVPEQHSVTITFHLSCFQYRFRIFPFSQCVKTASNVRNYKRIRPQFECINKLLNNFESRGLNMIFHNFIYSNSIQIICYLIQNRIFQGCLQN